MMLAVKLLSKTRKTKQNKQEKYDKQIIGANARIRK